MKKFSLFILIVLFMGAIAAYFFLNRTAPNVFLVKIKGGFLGYNLTKTDDQILSGFDSDSILAIPATEGDLITLLREDNESAFVFPVTRNDREVLNMKCDSFGLFLDNRLISITIKKENGSFEWLRNQLNGEEIHLLRSVIINDSIPRDCLSGLRKIVESVSEVKLVLSSNPGYLPEILQMANHVVLIAEDFEMDSTTIKAFRESKNIEVAAVAVTDFDFTLYPGLKQLIIADLDSASENLLANLPAHVTSLNIVHSEISNLKFLEKTPQLQELNLIKSGVKDISAVKSLKNLRILSLIGDSVPDLAPVNTLNSLQWFAPPVNLQSADLENLAVSLPKLESMVLFKCDQLQSLSSLKKLENFGYLTLIETHVAADSLFSFGNLKYLAYHTGEDTDSLDMIRLHKELPDTFVVPAEPFCLGSGWLILYSALVILSSAGVVAYRKITK